MATERTPLSLYISAAIFLLVIGAIVFSSVNRPEPPSFALTTMEPRDAGGLFVVDTVTIDARDDGAWVFFDFDVGTTIDESRAGEWDLAVSRFHLVTNGGSGYLGQGGAIATPTPWDSVTVAPTEGYTITQGTLDRGGFTPALERWYDYSVLAHTLNPKDETYVVRTAEGRYAKFQILSYYCPQATPGCVTMEYGYQADGSTRLAQP